MSQKPPLSTVVMRDAIIDDVAAIDEIERLSFVHAGERFGDRRVRYLIGSPRAIVTVAEVEGRVLGWAAAFAWLRGREPWGRIYALAVHPDARGRKLGPVLMHQMMDALRGRGAGRIFLEVRPDNHAAVRLYERLGFVKCRFLDHYYGPGKPAQRMAVSIGGRR
jgi:ribosomal-protein-alanine N-acetyltransferase